MTLAEWIMAAIVAMAVWGSLSTIAKVGEPRPIITPRVAALATAINVVFIVALVYVWGQL